MTPSQIRSARSSPLSWGIRYPRYRTYESRTVYRLQPGHRVIIRSISGTEYEVDMKVILTPDEVVAKVWDDYLHRFGAEEYVMARYLTPPTTMPMNEDALDSLPVAFLSPT